MTESMEHRMTWRDVFDGIVFIILMLALLMLPDVETTGGCRAQQGPGRRTFQKGKSTTQMHVGPAHSSRGR